MVDSIFANAAKWIIKLATSERRNDERAGTRLPVKGGASALVIVQRTNPTSQRRFKMIAPILASQDHASATLTESRSAVEIEQVAREWIAENCPYHYYFRHVEFEFYKGVLTLHGRVHSST